MPKSRDIQVKIPSPKAIFNGFWLVTVKVLNSYITSILSWYPQRIYTLGINSLVCFCRIMQTIIDSSCSIVITGKAVACGFQVGVHIDISICRRKICFHIIVKGSDCRFASVCSSCIWKHRTVQRIYWHEIQFATFTFKLRCNPVIIFYIICIFW